MPKLTDRFLAALTVEDGRDDRLVFDTACPGLGVPAVNALDQIVKAGRAVTAGRTMAYARACFAWGKRRGKVPENPFAELPISAGATERERVLSDAEIAQVWAAANTLGYPFGPFYRLMILTLQRPEEVAGMRWSEIADDMSRWTLLRSRMKNGKPHDVHLSEAARGAALGSARRGVRPRVHDHRPPGQRPRCGTEGHTQGRAEADVWLFARQALPRCCNRKALSEAAIRAGDKLQPISPWRVHDLR